MSRFSKCKWRLRVGKSVCRKSRKLSKTRSRVPLEVLRVALPLVAPEELRVAVLVARMQLRAALAHRQPTHNRRGMEYAAFLKEREESARVFYVGTKEMRGWHIAGTPACTTR